MKVLKVWVDSVYPWEKNPPDGSGIFVSGDHIGGHVTYETPLLLHVSPHVHLGENSWKPDLDDDPRIMLESFLTNGYGWMPLRIDIMGEYILLDQFPIERDSFTLLKGDNKWEIVIDRLKGTISRHKNLSNVKNQEPFTEVRHSTIKDIVEFHDTFWKEKRNTLITLKQLQNGNYLIINDYAFSLLIKGLSKQIITNVKKCFSSFLSTGFETCQLGKQNEYTTHHVLTNRKPSKTDIEERYTNVISHLFIDLLNWEQTDAYLHIFGCVGNQIHEMYTFAIDIHTIHQFLN